MCHPLELKVLAALRVLGRNCTFDDAEEATFISSSALRSFFLQFVKHYAITVAPRLLETPTSAEAIAECVAGYAAAGFPAFVGSVSS